MGDLEIVCVCTHMYLITHNMNRYYLYWIKLKTHIFLFRVWFHFSRWRWKSQSSAIPSGKKKKKSPQILQNFASTFLVFMIGRFKATCFSNILLYEISGQNVTGVFPVIVSFNLNCELPACHKDDEIMFYKKEKVVSYTYKVALASL